jgi:hypothetical protein
VTYLGERGPRKVMDVEDSSPCSNPAACGEQIDQACDRDRQNERSQILSDWWSRVLPGENDKTRSIQSESIDQKEV